MVEARGESNAVMHDQGFGNAEWQAGFPARH
jgi:hypothetical protein